MSLTASVAPGAALTASAAPGASLTAASGSSALASSSAPGDGTVAGLQDQGGVLIFDQAGSNIA